MNIYDKLELIPGKPSRNRIVMPAMDTQMSKDGSANTFHIQHYASKAYGGVGTIIQESTAVSEEGRIRELELGLWSDDLIDSYKPVIEEVHRAGAVFGVQLNHAGSKAEVQLERYGATKYYTYMDEEFGKLNIVTDEDIERIKQQFIDAAVRAKKAGFDFVELHGAHGYLIHQILAKAPINDYNPELPMVERGKFVIDIVKAIKEDVGIPVGVRLSVSDADPRGNEPKDYKEFIEALNPYVSYIHASSGVLFEKDKLDYSNGPLVGLGHAQEIKTYTDHPVVTVRNYQNKAQVEQAMAAGIDGVALGRELLFNPNMVVNELIEPEDLDGDLYHWNNNPWYNHKGFSTFQKKIAAKAK